MTYRDLDASPDQDLDVGTGDMQKVKMLILCLSVFRSERFQRASTRSDWTRLLRRRKHGEGRWKRSSSRRRRRS